MRIANNMTSINILNKQHINQTASSKTMEKLSSGLRINHASDDAAGLAISQKMKAQIRGLNMAERNIQDGVSLTQTADGGLSNINDPFLLRLRELAIQSANGTLINSDRDKIQTEVNEIKKAIDDIANNTTFNGIHLLNGANPNGTTSVVTPPEYNYENVLSLTLDSMGRVNMRTNLGYPHTTDDDNKTLVYPGLGTSKTSVLLNNSQIQLWGTIPTAIDNVGTDEYNVTWSLSDIEVIQNVKIVEDKFAFTYSTKNTSVVPQDIGFYYTIDVMLGNDDTAPFIINGSIATNEETYSGVNLPEKFTVFNNLGEDIQAEGIISGSSILVQPDEFRIGQYFDVSSAYGWTDTDQSTGDSGYAVMWNERTINPGDTFVINHFYGISIPPTLPSIPPPTPVEEGPYDIFLQVGANAGNQFMVELSDVRTNKLGIDTLDLSTINDASNSITSIDDAMRIVSEERSKYGAYQNGLEHTIRNVANSAENLAAAESRISDADMAKEIMEKSKLDILAQAANAMLAQSNQIPQGILQLIKG